MFSIIYQMFLPSTAEVEMLWETQANCISVHFAFNSIRNTFETQSQQIRIS